MTTCQGKKGNGSKCNTPLYKCPVCGKTGCRQQIDGACPNQAFVSNRCKGCGHQIANWSAAMI